MKSETLKTKTIIYPEKLSDSQLFSLYQNDGLAKNLKAVLSVEISRRGIAEDELKSLRTSFRSKHTLKSKPLRDVDRFVITLFPFLLPIHMLVSTWFLIGTNPMGYRQYWRCVKSGLVLWTVGAVFVTWLVKKD